MAILIAAVVGLKDITIYSLDIVIAMAWLASTVHLATFPLLVKDLKNHSYAKLIRVIIMCLASIILVIGLILQLSENWDSVIGVYFHCSGLKWKLPTSGMFYFVLSVFVPLSILDGTIAAVRWLYGRDDNDSDSYDRRADSQEDQTVHLPPNGVRLPGNTGHCTQGGVRGLSEDSRSTQPLLQAVDQNKRSGSQDDGQNEGSTSTTYTHTMSSGVSEEQGIELEERDVEQGHPRVPSERRNAADPCPEDQSDPESLSGLPKPPKRTFTQDLKSSPNVWKTEKSRLMLLWLKDEAEREITENRSIRHQELRAWLPFGGLGVPPVSGILHVEDPLAVVGKCFWGHKSLHGTLQYNGHVWESQQIFFWPDYTFDIAGFTFTCCVAG